MRDSQYRKEYGLRSYAEHAHEQGLQQRFGMGGDRANVESRVRSLGSRSAEIRVRVGFTVG